MFLFSCIEMTYTGKEKEYKHEAQNFELFLSMP